MATIRKAPHGKGHRYYVSGDERVDPARPLATVSQIAGYAGSRKGDGLLYWAVDQYIKTHQRNGFDLSRSRSAAIGSELHQQISEYIVEGEHPSTPSALFGAWYSSMHERGTEWLDSERMVYHPEMLYAGTLDAIGIVDGIVTLFDWKTTNGLDGKGNRKALGEANHAAQIAGYRLALQATQENPIPEQLVICYIQRDTHEVAWRSVDVEKATRLFLNCHAMYTSENEGGFYV